MASQAQGGSGLFTVPGLPLPGNSLSDQAKVVLKMWIAVEIYHKDLSQVLHNIINEVDTKLRQLNGWFGLEGNQSPQLFYNDKDEDLDAILKKVNPAAQPYSDVVQPKLRNQYALILHKSVARVAHLLGPFPNTQLRILDVQFKVIDEAVKAEMEASFGSAGGPYENAAHILAAISKVEFSDSQNSEGYKDGLEAVIMGLNKKASIWFCFLADLRTAATAAAAAMSDWHDRWSVQVAQLSDAEIKKWQTMNLPEKQRHLRELWASINNGSILSYNKDYALKQLTAIQTLKWMPIVQELQGGLGNAISIMDKKLTAGVSADTGTVVTVVQGQLDKVAASSSTSIEAQVLGMVPFDQDLLSIPRVKLFGP